MADGVAAPEVFRSARAILGESLVWDGGSLLWCDITAGVIHISSEHASVDGSDDPRIAVAPPLASFAPALIDGQAGFIVSREDTVELIGNRGEHLRTLAEIAHARPGLRLNEGKLDPSGRWVTGSMNLVDTDPVGAFYSITAAGDVRVLRGGIGVANGLEWSRGGDRVYFTDTSVQTIYTGDYSADGSISGVEPFVQDGPHDGLVMDADGNLWSAFYGEGVVVQYDPAGRRLRHVDLPAPNVTSVAFGGADLSTLFVTSARENLTEEQLEQHPLSGAVFAIRTGTHGWPLRVFRA